MRHSSPLSKGRLRGRSGRVLRAGPPASGGSPTAATAATRAAAPPARAPALFLPPGAAGEMRSLWARTKIAGVSSRSFSELRLCHSVLTGFPGAAIRGLCSKHAVDAFPPPACCWPRQWGEQLGDSPRAALASRKVLTWRVRGPATRPAPAPFCPPG